MTIDAPARANDALKHAWDWFDLHSKQRMQTINFYIIVVGASLAATVTTLREEQYLATSLVGLFLTFISLLFFLMDRRARLLVRIGENALRIEQARLAGNVENSALLMIDASDASSKAGVTYGRLFYAMFVVLGAFGILMTIIAAWVYFAA